MKIYTRLGDSGQTGIRGAERVSKNDVRIRAVGEVDELNSWLGLIAAEIEDPIQQQLFEIQSDLHTLCADLATPLATTGALRIHQDAVTRLEAWIDRTDAQLEPQTSFILMGGTPAAARLFVARSICRRAERAVVGLHEPSRTVSDSREDQCKVEPQLPPEGTGVHPPLERHPANPSVLEYLNRLSDLLFTLARQANRLAGCPERKWIPGN